MTLAEVRLWGTTVGAVLLEDGARAATFEYTEDFALSGREVAPLMMPLDRRPYSFPGLNAESFHGLPGMLADSLPDRYGQALIDAWLQAQGRRPGSFDAVERLCYIGTRGMGALEFRPSTGPDRSSDHEIDVSALAELAQQALTNKDELAASLAEPEQAMRDILSVGTSAGGARAKAVIAWNPATGQVRSGQAEVPAGFEHWLLKFDGVTDVEREDLGDPQGFGVVEFAYANMARAAGLDMAACRLLDEGGRRHFMTRRFDRGDDGGKVHMQSLAAMAHLDFLLADVYSYEQAFGVMRELGLELAMIEQQFRRMTFNVVARNQDDHVKNIAFLMDRDGVWSLAPAFDVTYAYNPTGDWTARHQMSLNGKRDAFTLADFSASGKVAGLKRGRAAEILTEVIDVARGWETFAHAAGVDERRAAAIGATFRLGLVTRSEAVSG